MYHCTLARFAYLMPAVFDRQHGLHELVCESQWRHSLQNLAEARCPCICSRFKCTLLLQSKDQCLMDNMLSQHHFVSCPDAWFLWESARLLGVPFVDENHPNIYWPVGIYRCNFCLARKLSFCMWWLKRLSEGLDLETNWQDWHIPCMTENSLLLNMSCSLLQGSRSKTSSGISDSKILPSMDFFHHRLEKTNIEFQVSSFFHF